LVVQIGGSGNVLASGANGNVLLGNGARGDVLLAARRSLYGIVMDQSETGRGSQQNRTEQSGRNFLFSLP
jgi:hypothetical protein